jgi:hypothetical protein
MPAPTLLDHVCARIAILAVASFTLSCAGTHPGTPRSDEPGVAGTATDAPSQLTLNDLASRLILYVTPVHGEPDVDFCSLRREITADRNPEILTGAASAARGWADWCMKERAAIETWFGSDPDAISRVRIWIRQPVGDHNALADGDMPADTVRHHLDAHPESRLYEGMADAYQRHLLAPPARPALARAWFYAGAPDNDAQPSHPAPNFAGLSAPETLARYQRDYVEWLNAGSTPLIAPGSIGRIAIDKSTPYGMDSGTYLIGKTYPDELMYEPLGLKGNPWVANAAWTGLILEDTFWERLGPGSRSAQPSEVQGPHRALLQPPHELHASREVASILRHAPGTRVLGRGLRRSDGFRRGGSAGLLPPSSISPICRALRKDCSRGTTTGVPHAACPRSPRMPSTPPRACSARSTSFDGPYTQQDSRSGPARRERVPAGREHE